jgi:hypothetical protein
MKNEKILIKARNVLANNKHYKEMSKWFFELQGKEPETPEEMIFICGDHVTLSNECSVEVTNSVYTSELISSLSEDLSKAGIGWECYDLGTFHLFWEVQ